MCQGIARPFRFALTLLLVPMPLFAQRTKVVEVAPPPAPVELDELQLAPLDIWVNENGDTMTGTLTLNPGGDQALDLASGSIYKGGALFMHTNGGADNIALGQNALSSVTTGIGNTACGAYALESNTAGHFNTASGVRALRSNTYGSSNTASGARALYSNTTGYRNTASGARALYSNTTGAHNTASGVNALRSNTRGRSNTASGGSALASNTTGSYGTAIGKDALFSNTTGVSNTATGVDALRASTTGSSNTASGVSTLLLNTTGNSNTASGMLALFRNTTGSNNIALGYGAGRFLTTGSNNIAIGNAGVVGDVNTIRIGTSGDNTRAFVAGIRGFTTGVADAVNVMIDSAGQLGTVSSSRRFKEDIVDMADATDRLLDLRAVLFRYKERNEDGNGPIEFGLIAEEVAEVFPELVVYDKKGLPETVKYHLLSTMLLNELQKEHKRVEQLQARDAELETRIAALEQRE